ncbi:hypothetical protein KP509_10G060500 [Ceratopteris richardii]|nr:hypothetical protein KP509_10G060500 [Ceratopteris richardii]
MKSLLKGDKSLRETNRAALESAFFRTIDLLTISLEEVCHQQELKDGSWFWALIHSLFLKNVGAIQQKLSLECILTYLFSILFGSVKSSRTARELIGASTINMKRSNLNTVAEKLVCELLWVTEKLKDGSTLNEAARSWATLHTLAKLSLSAHSRIQACLLRISVMLLKESTLYGPDTYSSNLKVNILLLWLPLFCNVKIGFDYPCLTPSEKADFFRDLEQIVLSLSVVDQERVLTCWLREYISSTSEWPNLQECFENWYFSAKKPSDMAAL